MRLVVLGAVAIVIWAAFISISSNVQPLKTSELVASTMLTLAVAIQRINGIQRWLSAPKDKRKEQVSVLGQQALINVCKNRPVSDELLDVYVHVWEVPLWYRRLFPYAMRKYLKSVVRRKPLRLLTRWVIRPTLHRVAAVGLVKPAPSGVRFRKGLGLIGVCVANNDRAEFITLNIANTKYRRALSSTTEEEWLKSGPEITHNLSLADAQRLARSYGQVIGKVVQDPESGEAIGCATISCKHTSPRKPHTMQLTTQDLVKRNLTDLTLSLANVLG